jgi:hypothetical protein
MHYMVSRVRQKFAQWRKEPEAVRLRIATLLTAGSGAVVVALWLFVLLPLQLVMSRPSSPDAVTEEFQAAITPLNDGEVAGVADIPTPTPSPTPGVEYYHGTRPSLQE